MRKIYILYIATISILSLVYINNTSALDYSSNIDIGFTFNPTLSISLSSSDLVISNLKPGTTEDSNSINVSIATNAAYGYTLSANVGDDIHNNSNLTHTNNTNIFSSIDTNADLASLDTDNTWGYTSKLSNETAWSNYSGLSNSSNAILLDNSNAADSTGDIDFKIAAKAGSTQPSGEYTGTINFTAVTKPTPMNLAESYFAHGKTRYNGYYTMQDMTTEICNDTEVIGEGSQTELIDLRDDKVYWATKLKDGHCWMTQNLDLDLSTSTIFTSNDTDLNDNSLSGAYSQATGYSYDSATNTISWRPANSTNTWTNSAIYPYSKDRGKYYPEGTPENETINDYHRLNGNYYNWTAAIASNDSSTIVNDTYEDIDASPQNSVCPKGWRLPTISSVARNNEFSNLVNLYGNTITQIMASPLWFVRSGYVISGSALDSGSYGYYWSSTVDSSTNARRLSFYGSYINPANSYSRNFGFSVRCLAH